MTAHDHREFVLGCFRCELSRDEVTACCEYAYVCPGSGEGECLTHGGFDNCCDHPQCPGNRRSTEFCGGCRGMGAHQRWCEVHVGRTASMLGRYAARAESLGDSVGPNEMGAANHLWAAAGLLREEAGRAKETFQSQQPAGSGPAPAPGTDEHGQPGPTDASP